MACVVNSTALSSCAAVVCDLGRPAAGAEALRIIIGLACGELNDVAILIVTGIAPGQCECHGVATAVTQASFDTPLSLFWGCVSVARER